MPVCFPIPINRWWWWSKSMAPPPQVFAWITSHHHPSIDPSKLRTADSDCEWEWMMMMCNLFYPFPQSQLLIGKRSLWMNKVSSLTRNNERVNLMLTFWRCLSLSRSLSFNHHHTIHHCPLQAAIPTHHHHQHQHYQWRMQINSAALENRHKWW